MGGFIFCALGASGDSYFEPLRVDREAREFVGVIAESEKFSTLRCKSLWKKRKSTT